MPRVQFNREYGIIGRYLDIYPLSGSYHGVRLSLDKNMSDASVQIDDTNLVTAMYGYGKDDATLFGYGWPETDEHPAKPYYEYFIVDPEATALYGRGGLPRFGFYRNGSLTSTKDLLEKTWETLQQVNHPRITIDGVVNDLYRMGYHDEPLALYDTVYVELRPMKKVYALEISTLIVDLLDPTQTQISIGKFYPNIIVIDYGIAVGADGFRRLVTAGGGGGGGGGGSGNGYGSSENTNKLDQLFTLLSGLLGTTLTAGQAKDGDGNMINVITWT
jgi:hypothetical protein